MRASSASSVGPSSVRRRLKYGPNSSGWYTTLSSQDASMVAWIFGCRSSTAPNASLLRSHTRLNRE
eukprot:1188097-Prorocentrum_minimum.AAC.1